MKKYKPILAGCIGFSLVALGGAIQLLRRLWVAHPENSHSFSVGIIGGADGPTAVFVTAPTWSVYVFPCLLLAAGIGGLVRLIRSRKEK